MYNKAFVFVKQGFRFRRIKFSRSCASFQCNRLHNFEHARTRFGPRKRQDAEQRPNSLYFPIHNVGSTLKILAPRYSARTNFQPLCNADWISHSRLATARATGLNDAPRNSTGEIFVNNTERKAGTKRERKRVVDKNKGQIGRNESSNELDIVSSTNRSVPSKLIRSLTEERWRYSLQLGNFLRFDCGKNCTNCICIKNCRKW